MNELTEEAIATVYFGATGQSLRPQDNICAHSFARAIIQADRAQRRANQAPVAIVAVTLNGGATVGWYPGYVAKHNDLLYAAPQPAQQPLTTDQYMTALGAGRDEMVCSAGTLKRIVRAIEQAHGIVSKR